MKRPAQSAQFPRRGHFFLRLIGLGDLLGRPKSVGSFGLLVLLTFFLYGDQNLTASSLARIGADLGFANGTDYLYYVGGLPSALFFLLGGVVSLGAGYLADRFWQKRRLWIVLAVLSGETCCLLTTWAPNYWVFLLLRCGTGLGAGGLFPVLFSLFGDWFRAENRPTGSAWLGLAMGAGIGAGQLLSGLLAPLEFWGLPGWRWAFLLMAAPAFPLVLVFTFWARLPERGNSDDLVGAAERRNSNGWSLAASQQRRNSNTNSSDRATQRGNSAESANWSLRAIMGVPTNRFVFLQGIPGTVPWGFLFVFFVDYYQIVYGYSALEANVVLGALGAGALFGALLGGYFGRWLYRRNRAMLPLVCGVAVALGALPTLFLINRPIDSFTILLAVAALGGLVVPMTGANVRAILANVNPPHQRGSAFSVFNLTDDLGRGLGPFFVAALIVGTVRLFPDAPLTARVISANLAVGCWFASAVFWLLMARTVVADEDRFRPTVKQERR